MTVADTILEKVNALPKVRQQEVLDFAEFLGQKEKPQSPRRSMQGILADMNINFTESDLRDARNEMWHGYTKDTENEKQELNDVIIDTNIVIWYFSQPKLSSASAQAALDAATSDGSIFVTTITIVELTYLIDKKKIPADVLVALRNALDNSTSAIRVIDLNREISDKIEQIPRAIVTDMPDRIIAATALNLQLPLLTSDSALRKLKNIETVWQME